MAIASRCPVCKGKGKVARELPFGANPRAPATRHLGLKTCPKCQGKGTVGKR